MKLRVEDVGKDFLIPVIDRVSFDVAAGEFVCLLGPNGCGKTTLLRIVGGLEPATRGRVLVDDAPVIAQQRHDRRIGVVFQEDRLLPWKTVRENVELVLRPLGLRARERTRVADGYLALVGLRGFEHYYPARVSGGMRQRAAIARALAIEPDVLLMDEPFGALDAQTREIMQQDLLEIWRQTGRTIVFVTHSVQEAVFLGDRIAVMTARPGRVKAIIDVGLAHPRDVTSAEFGRLMRPVYAALKEEVLKTLVRHPTPTTATLEPAT